jgi:uncharacterized protein (DUF2249 family)
MTPFRVIDGRELQPPEPFELTIEALEEMPAGQHVVLLLNCYPQPLFNYLHRNGYRWTIAVEDDGTNAIRIEHAGER